MGFFSDAVNNVFSRGDFDEYKISDEELEEIENKEIDKSTEKSYTKREFVSGNGKRKSYWRTRTYDGIEGKKNFFLSKEKKSYYSYCGNITESLKNGKSFFIKNPNGEYIEITQGSYKKSDGLRHIIKRRVTEYTHNKPISRNEKIKLINEISHILCMITDNLSKCKLDKDYNGNYFVQKDGVKAIVTKTGKKKWLLSGYVLYDERNIAEGVIAARSAGNNYSPDFLGMYDQVGASVTHVILTFSKKKSSENVTKSLTFSGYKLQGRTKLYGMDISIENKKGSYRSGTDSDGHEWKTLMNYDYGYIRHTEGTDGDFVDVYIGPDKNAQKVYVIHQNNPVTHEYDEDKCMLCFESADAAKKAYMKQYDRPGFFGSMETLSIEKFKEYVFNNKGKRIHKSLDYNGSKMAHKSFVIDINDITVNNREKKALQVEKSLMAVNSCTPFKVNHISGNDGSKKLGNLSMLIRNFDMESINKAVRTLSFTLDTPLKSAKCGECFVYKSQEELTDRIVSEITEKTKDLYDFVIDYFGLPEKRIMTKAYLKYKGKLVYDPETGKPIKKKDWDKFVEQLEKFLNRNYTGIGEKIVLKAETLGRIIERMSKNGNFEAIKKMSLDDMEYKRRKFDWISDSVKNMTDTFGETLSRERMARVQVAIDSAANRVTHVTDTQRNSIQQILIDGVKNKKSKSKISQELFDTCVGANRDFQRIADTEIQANSTRAYIDEEVYNTKPEEKVYFKRFEQLDDNTCKKCKKLKNMVVLWSDYPLDSEKIKDPYADYAIWDGKTDGEVPQTTLHPWCRGTWYRYYPDV